MQVIIQKDHNTWLTRLFNGHIEVAYGTLGISGLEANIEFPSDWHESERAWVRLGFGLFKICFSFPWKWVVPDKSQCSGPRYGFIFFERGVHVYYGKDKYSIFDMPWAWKNVRWEVLNTSGNFSKYLSEYSDDPLHVFKDARKIDSYPYTYVLKNGDIQERIATIYVTEMECRWKWLQWLSYPRIIDRSIDISFDNEVGEKTGSWKGGVTGCSYKMLPGETPYKTLMRMQKERKF